MRDSEPSSRARLLAAAKQAIADEGWRGATSRAIAQRADTNLALINYYFGSKDALLLAALDDAMARLAEAGSGPVGEGVAGLRAATLAFFEDQTSGVHMRVLFEASLAAPRDEAVASAVRTHLAAFRQYVVAALTATQGVCTEDTVGLARVVAAFLDGLLLHVAIDPSTPVEPTVDAFFAAIEKA